MYISMASIVIHCGWDQRILVAFVWLQNLYGFKIKTANSLQTDCLTNSLIPSDKHNATTAKAMDFIFHC